MMETHSKLAAGAWAQMNFCEQMANVGSEVERAFNWRNKNNQEYSEKALNRALELIKLTIAATDKASYLRELTRVREVILDFFYGNNDYNMDVAKMKKYFYYFGVSARK